ncbi:MULTISPECIES: hypothetical protein [Pseudanabaena]|uniref:DUF2203 domain-containing protein n=2 Tax=Pseudanabaena TaxID=1152 RepID=L8N485_9CYAN|nr:MULTISPECIES: hypothetical protein [Pseudanabaena]ELS34486.1 hypothetical protein Pse7429DRAFT_0481 [Pseudanabaena biceps PCC 7429]MDG3493355.1 hypothetical protein [Pseudanabaena catenata USMAC16]
MTTEISDWSDLEAELQETKALLEEVEQRFLQVRRDALLQQELKTEREQIRSQIDNIADARPQKNNSHKSKLGRIPDHKHGRVPANNANNYANLSKDELLKQLQEVGDRLEQVEANLESRLLSWSSFREPFWQIVRFGGLGIIIGIVLRSCAS